MKKSQNLIIGLSVKSPESNLSKENAASEELRKIMDDIWQRYPNAEVAKGMFYPEGSSVVFEIK